jgi:hypothetical protein
MCLEFRTSRGNSVVVLGGARLSSLKEWVAEVDSGVLKTREGAADALLLDFRSPAFTPDARETLGLVSALCGEMLPPVAVLTNPGPQYGGAQVLCALGELRGCVAAAFQEEDEAWAWVHEQLDEDLSGAAAPVPGSRSGHPQVQTC